MQQKDHHAGQQTADERFMRMALTQARRAARSGEVPVGAVLVLETPQGPEIIARRYNRPIHRHDPTAHAEIVALRAAGRRLRNYRLTDTTLYVTVEPCAMCAGALVQARIGRLVYGCADPKAGAVRSLHRLADDARLNHRMEITAGVLAEDGAALLRDFFRSRRASKTSRASAPRAGN